MEIIIILKDDATGVNISTDFGEEINLNTPSTPALEMAMAMVKHGASLGTIEDVKLSSGD